MASEMTCEECGCELNTGAVRSYVGGAGRWLCKPCCDDEAMAQSEAAMQAGMGLGIDAYNDEMGCGR